MLASVPGIDDLSLSTNGVLLEDHAEDLRVAGVRRVNISLDSLRPERIDALARRPGSAGRIMARFDAAERVGFEPIKVNVVLMRGANDDEIADFAALTRERPWHVRFIELMPTGSNLALSAEAFVSCTEALRRPERDRAARSGRGAARETARPPTTASRARPERWEWITPMSHDYCDRCNRMRLTADGQLRRCFVRGHSDRSARTAEAGSRPAAPDRCDPAREARAAPAWCRGATPVPAAWSRSRRRVAESIRSLRVQRLVPAHRSHDTRH